jgi:serine protease AprX
MATPFVAGVCALMLEADDALTPAELKEILRGTAVDFGPPGEDIDYGAGRLDGCAAVREAEKPARRLADGAPLLPAHRFVSGSLNAKGHDEWSIDVADGQNCIAAVLILPAWTTSEPAQFQLRLFDPEGLPAASSAEDARSQLIRFRPTRPGAYTLRIDAISGQGPYFVDLSCDAAPAAQVLKQ